MDPEAALKRAEEAALREDFEECDDALGDLERWLRMGGFKPVDCDERIAAITERVRAYLRGRGVPEA
jgi:hypothetical protein